MKPSVARMPGEAGEGRVLKTSPYYHEVCIQKMSRFPRGMKMRAPAGQYSIGTGPKITSEPL